MTRSQDRRCDGDGAGDLCVIPAGANGCRATFQRTFHMSQLRAEAEKAREEDKGEDDWRDPLY